MKVTLPWNFRSTTVVITQPTVWRIHRYTKNTNIFTYFDSVVLLEINPQEIFQKEKMLHLQKCSFHCHFNGGEEESYFYAQQQVDGLFCDRWKRFKMKVNLIDLPASSTLAPCAPSWLAHNSQDDSHKLQREQVSLRLKTISFFFPRPYSVAPANSLTSNSLGGPLAYWPPSCPKKDQVHWGVFALVLFACNLFPPENTHLLTSFGSRLQSPVLPAYPSLLLMR